jgi:hypothetical protein
MTRRKLVAARTERAGDFEAGLIADFPATGSELLLSTIVVTFCDFAQVWRFVLLHHVGQRDTAGRAPGGKLTAADATAKGLRIESCDGGGLDDLHQPKRRGSAQQRFNVCSLHLVLLIRRTPARACTLTVQDQVIEAAVKDSSGAFPLRL